MREVDMNLRTIVLGTASLLAIAALTACAGTGSIISSPDVRLTSIEITSADFDKQTFLIGFVVSNPNPFPLPIKSVRYRVQLGEQQFASGETQGNFTVPSDGNGEFAISVDLNLLRTTSNISSLIRSGMSRDFDYELSGSFAVDIPFAKPVQFKSGGNIELQAAAF
jgi:LEA14-like dessication related protein